MIQVSNLSKWYGPLQALRDVSFRVDEGEIVGLLGPNGAGKTTTIKILTGYLHPDEGTVLIGGMDVLAHTREVQAILGYLPENAPLYPELSVQGYLQMIAELRQEREKIEEVLVALERLARGQGKRRGRPPAWMMALQQKKAAKKAAAPSPTGKRRGRPPKNPQPQQ